MKVTFIDYWIVVTLNPPSIEKLSLKNRVLYYFLRALDKKYRHVMAFGYVENIKKWIVIDPASDALHIYMMDYDRATLIDHFQKMRDAGDIDMRVVIPEKMPAEETWQIRPFLTCASIIAHHIGLRATFGGPYTPKKLIKAIDKQQK